MTDQLWTVDQAARFLQKSRRWIYYALRVDEEELGSIPHTRIGRSLRFDPEILKEWAMSGCPPAAAMMKRNRRAGSAGFELHATPLHSRGGKRGTGVQTKVQKKGARR